MRQVATLCVALLLATAPCLGAARVSEEPRSTSQGSTDLRTAALPAPIVHWSSTLSALLGFAVDTVVQVVDEPATKHSVSPGRSSTESVTKRHSTTRTRNLKRGKTQKPPTAMKKSRDQPS